MRVSRRMAESAGALTGSSNHSEVHINIAGPIGIFLRSAIPRDGMMHASSGRTDLLFATNNGGGNLRLSNSRYLIKKAIRREKAVHL